MQNILNTKLDVNFDKVLLKCEETVNGLKEDIFRPYNECDGPIMEGWYDQLLREYEDQIAATVAWTVAGILDLTLAYYDPRRPGADVLDQWMSDINNRHPEWHIQEDWFDNRPITVPEYYYPEID